jgi:hypothetical protein
MTEQTTGAIAAALAGFQADMPVVPKNKTAKLGTYSYKYADLADVTAAAMPVLHTHGLAFSACPRRSDHGYELVGLLLHTSGETLHGSLPLHGEQPQAIGSALTYARRYLLGSMTGLVTDDDDDGRSAASAKRTQPKVTAKTRATMYDLFTRKGITPDIQLVGVNTITHADYTSVSDLTEAHAKQVCEALLQRPDVPPVRPTKPALVPGVSVVPAGGPLSAGEAFAAFAPEAAAREAAERIAAETGLDKAHMQAGGGSSEGEASGPSPAVVSPGSSAAAGVEPVVTGEPTPPVTTGAKKATRATQRMIFATLGTLGIADEDEGYERKLIASRITGRHVYSFNDLTTGEASHIIDTLASFGSSADLYAHLDTLPDPS